MDLLERTPPAAVAGRAWRVVESQRQIATTTLVDNLEEQAVLEELLENSKPKYPPGCEHLHYLLKTPFRYPPLRWGSRFGNRFQPGLFYAAKTQTTALAEAAFYRLLFFDGMQDPPAKLISQHLLFAVDYASQRAVQLQSPPYNQYHDQLTDPSSYKVCQTLGEQLRQLDYEVIEFTSARDSEAGINVALLQPQPLRSCQPEQTLPLLIQTGQLGVAVKLEQNLLQFPKQQFLVEGRLAYPN